MSTQQAFIEGFVKRAVDLGFDERVLEKIALSIPVGGLAKAKGIIRGLGDIGVNLRRGGETLQEGKGLKGLFNNAVSKVQDAAAKVVGPHYMPGVPGAVSPTINIPREHSIYKVQNAKAPSQYLEDMASRAHSAYDNAANRQRGLAAVGREYMPELGQHAYNAIIGNAGLPKLKPSKPLGKTITNMLSDAWNPSKNLKAKYPEYFQTTQLK